MENARSVETILSEDDDDSVQLMTIHAAKGLEFPIAIIAGLPLQARQENGVRVGYPPGADKPEVKISKDLQTNGFENWAEAEQLFGHDESIRNLYVACTRARPPSDFSPSQRITVSFRCKNCYICLLKPRRA